MKTLNFFFVLLRKKKSTLAFQAILSSLPFIYIYLILIFHSQICTSDFVGPIWFDGFFTIRFANESDRRSISESDFRVRGLTMFYAIALLCLHAQQLAGDIQNMLFANKFFGANAFSRKWNHFSYMSSLLFQSFSLSTSISNMDLKYFQWLEVDAIRKLVDDFRRIPLVQYLDWFKLYLKNLWLAELCFVLEFWRLNIKWHG